MTLRMALRSLAAQPVRSALLACGFGLGIASMAGLLGVGEVILEQSRSPSLRGGGDLAVYGATGEVGSARFLISQVFRLPPLAGRIAAVSPSLDRTLYLVDANEPPLAMRARGGIPSLERAMQDPETSGVPTWADTSADVAWLSPDPGDVLRSMDRFHPIPDVPERADSWAEWLYFNGRAGDVRFYLTFMVGARTAPGRREAGVRLQLERQGRVATFVDRDVISEDQLLAEAPDLRIGNSRVVLQGRLYRAELALFEQQTSGHSQGRPGGDEPDLTGFIELEAIPGRSIPPFEVGGARGWVSGYVVPVLSGPLDGSLELGDEVVSLENGEGYHDHNWGFWEGVTWQWGQVSTEELSLVYGRIRPPADAVDPDRMPGLLVALGPDGPLGYATGVRIDETDDPQGRPARIVVRGESEALSLELALTVEDAVLNRLEAGRSPAPGRAVEFLQLRARYHVTGSVGERRIDFTAGGAAETFRLADARPFTD